MNVSSIAKCYALCKAVVQRVFVNLLGTHKKKATPTNDRQQREQMTRSEFRATGLEQQSTIKEVTERLPRGSKVVPDLRFASYAKTRVVEKKLPIGDPFWMEKKLQIVKPFSKNGSHIIFSVLTCVLH